MAVGQYFTRYRQQLSPLIGVEAADVVVSFYKWSLGGITGMLLLPPVLALTVNPGSSALGLAALLVVFFGGCVCGLRGVIIGNRGGQLAAAYLTNRLGHPVSNHGAKMSLRWWRDVVDREERRSADE
jgi:hypothetical protein